MVKRILLLMILITLINSLSGEKILIGSEPDYPPYCLINSSGKAEGFSIDLFDAAAQAVDLEYEIKIDLWQNIKDDLARGDLAALPLVGRNPEREKYLDFTFPYMSLHGAVFVRKHNQRIKSRADLTGKSLIVMKGDNAEEYVHRVNLSSNIVLTDTYEEAFRLLSNGRHDAVITQRVMGLQLLKELSITNVRALDMQLKDFRQDFCFAVQEGDKELLEQLNEGLAIVISDGTFDRLYQKWFSPTIYYSLSFWEKLKSVMIVLIPLVFLIIIIMYLISKREIKRKTYALQKEVEEKKAALYKLQETEAKFQSYVDKAPSGIFVADENGFYIDVNAAACKITGYTKDELIGMNLGELIEPSFREEARESFNKVISDGIMSHEIPFVHKTGEVRYWRVDASRLTENTYLGFTVDTTDKQMAREELNRNRDQLQYLFDNMNSGFAYHKLIQDENGNPVDYEYLEINRIFETMLGFRRENVIGRTVLELFPGTAKDPANWILRYGKVALSGIPEKFESYSEAAGRWFSVSVYSPMKGYFATIFDDITERKKTDEKLKLYQEKLEELVKERTHDLRESNKELERFNKLFIGREFRIKELRDRIRALEDKLKELQR